MVKLNFEYFTGQIFALDQKTMNRMIEDIHALKAENLTLQEDLTWVNTLRHEDHKCVGLLEKVALEARRVLRAQSKEAEEAALGELEDAVHALPQEPSE